MCGKFTDADRSRFETSKGLGGIFLKSSRFNHACHPHSTCTYRWDEAANTLTFTTLMEVKKGEEITISYTNKPRTLHDNYGFDCDCPKCSQPKDPKEDQKATIGANPKI
jgi:SET domain-containing protein